MSCNEQQAILTVARGRSDPAAQYLSYLAMSRPGRPVTSLPMSGFTLHAAQLRCQEFVPFAFSQSGKSPERVTPTQVLCRAGALLAALRELPALLTASAAADGSAALPVLAGAERQIVIGRGTGLAAVMEAAL